MRSTIKTSLILTFLSIFLVIVIIAAILLSKSTTPEKETGYYMKSLNNTVVLYKDRDIVKVYDGIVVDTLPITDRDLLERGIHYENITDADMAAEDYDG